jgi:hypothetical protein
MVRASGRFESEYACSVGQNSGFAAQPKDRPMALDIDARAFADHLPEIEPEPELEMLWAENATAAAGAAIAVLFVSSVAVLMYFA